jgi:hypothetical protein
MSDVLKEMQVQYTIFKPVSTACGSVGCSYIQQEAQISEWSETVIADNFPQHRVFASVRFLEFSKEKLSNMASIQGCMHIVFLVRRYSLNATANG